MFDKWWFDYEIFAIDHLLNLFQETFQCQTITV